MHFATEDEWPRDSRDTVPLCEKCNNHFSKQLQLTLPLSKAPEWLLTLMLVVWNSSRAKDHAESCHDLICTSGSKEDK